MKKFLIASAIALALSGEAGAQGPSMCNVSTNPPTYQDGQTRSISCDPQGNQRMLATVTASVAGFAPSATGTPIAVTNAGVTGALPAGAVVAVFNVGATNTAFCKLGASATVNDIAIPAGGWFAYTVGAATQLTCITSASTTTVNLIGGSGLPTGAAGGGSGGGGTVNQGTGGASAWLVTGTGGTFPATQSGAWNVTLLAGSALAGKFGIDQTTPGTTNGVQVNAALPAGTNIVGKVGIDQTTPGTTNGVQITAAIPAGANIIGALSANQSVNEAQINGVAPLMNNGVSGTGSQRINLASDNTAIGNWGQGATGAAVPSGAQYQGVNVGGNLTPLVGDPCQTVARVFTPINISSATTTQLVAAAASKKTYVCALFLFSAGAQNVGIVEGTGGTCAVGTAGVIGGTTAATGPNLTAQAGFVLPSTGYAQAATAATNTGFCLITSGTAQLSGVLVSVQQ